MRDHGGDLDRAKALYGGDDWLDLSTGINARPWPVPEIEPRAWAVLPTRADMARLQDAALRAYQTRAAITPLGGAQAAIQLVPRLGPPGRAAVLGPTYNEHAASLRAAGWQVSEVAALADLAGAGLAVVVNPNNPDGRRHAPDALRALARSVGLLVVDESFVDPTPELSLAPDLEAVAHNIIVLRSFGKFYGLAGIRLGFALSSETHAASLRALAGPWAVGGPAIAIGTRALADTGWHAATTQRLTAEAQCLDALAARAGWTLIGGTALFRTYETPNAAAVQDHLAHARIWTRIFPYAAGWVRLGLPGAAQDWARLEAALARDRGAAPRQ